MSIEVYNKPFSANDILGTSNLLNRCAVSIGYRETYYYYIFIAPRLTEKMRKLLSNPLVIYPNRKAL